jgi:hypothetical protein
VKTRIAIKRLAVLTALLFLAGGLAQAKERHTVHLSRLSIEPGVTLVLDPDWYACDRNINSQMHDREIPENIAAIICKPDPRGSDAIHLHNLIVRAPVSLLVDHLPLPTISAEALSGATPEMLAYLGQFDCSHMGQFLGVAQQEITSCATSIATVAQHTALLDTVALSFEGKTHRLRLYSIPYAFGELTLQFESTVGSQAAADAEIDSVVGTVEIGPGDFSALPVPLSPAPEVSLSLPSGWMACDDATNALLGSRRDVLGVRQQSCANAKGDDIRLFAFSPQLLQNISIVVSYRNATRLTEQQIAGYSQDQLTEITPRICDDVTKPLKDDLKPVDSCALSVEQIGGHSALVATTVGVFSGESDTDRARDKFYFVPYDQGLAMVQFIVPLIGEKVSQPVVDDIMRSIVIGKAQKP